MLWIRVTAYSCHDVIGKAFLWMRNALFEPTLYKSCAPNRRGRSADGMAKATLLQDRDLIRGSLDAEAEVYVLLVAGVGVGVVGGAVVELVTLAEFATDEEAECDRAETGGDPAYGLEKG